MGSSTSSLPSDSELRVFAVSDLHTDWDENMQLLSDHLQSNTYGKNDVLIVAGDISSDLEVVKDTLELLANSFCHVFFTNGNNELRLDRKDKFGDSFKKWKQVMDVASAIPNVYVQPKCVADQVWIVPLLSWYEPDLDPDYDQTTGYQHRWLDFRACRWPQEYYSDDNYLKLDLVTKEFLARNDEWLEKLSPASNDDDDDTKDSNNQRIISFSHFLPRFELLPGRMFLKNKTMPLVMGSPGLEQQIRRLNPTVHVCGHSHINFDKTIGGIRYVQNALGHPRERKAIWRRFESAYTPKLIYSTRLQNASAENDEDED